MNIFLSPAGDPRPCVSRRDFLFAGALSLSTVALSVIGAPMAAATGVALLKAEYPRRAIGTLSSLLDGAPRFFDYPHPGLGNALLRIGAPAGGGLGPGREVVAFSLACTHMGANLQDSLRPLQPTLGPCPRHLTSFDLSRHGMVITGHATESLPQIVLELEGDIIHAVGVMGLIFGTSAVSP